MKHTADGQWDVPQRPRNGVLMTQTFDLGTATPKAFAAVAVVAAGFHRSLACRSALE